MAINYEEVGELVDSVVFINRVAKVVKGGRRFSFSALVVVGDQRGYVGRRPRQGQRGPRGDPQGDRAGQEEPVPDPARRAAPSRTRCRGTSARARCCCVRPAPVPASSRAAPCARSSRSPGVQDILTKCIGTSNPHNVIHATIDALQQLRSADAAAGLRGKRLDEIAGVGHGQEAARDADPERHQPPRAAQADHPGPRAVARWASP